MLKKLILLSIALSVLLSSSAMAQSQAAAERMLKNGSRPMLEVNYGMVTPQFKGASFDFESIGLLEFKLGYAALDTTTTSVVSLFESYIFAGFANSSLGSSGSDGDAGSEFNRFGGGSRFGYGYQRKKMGLDLYTQDSMHWNKFSAADYDAADPEAQAIFDRYGSKYRFGHLMESALRVRVTPSMSFSAGMEGSIVYPRYVFWPWLGSVAIYSAVQGVVEYFGDEVIEASPGIGPVLYWLLKSGVSLGYYMASRDDMNWPFDSETPVTLESYKLGATFKF